MFVMMNAARLHVALQGIGLLDAAWQKAHAYSLERRQMRAPGRGKSAAEADFIAEHPAMRRILDTQRAWIDGGRVLAYRTALELDIAKHQASADPEAAARAQRWCSLITPVLKSAWTEQAFSGGSACLQVLGGHGYVSEWGIEQIVRDSRVAMIYEGTNEIQAIDLLARKVLADGGQGLAALLADLAAQLPAGHASHDRIKRLNTVTVTLAQAAPGDATLPYEVADDYLRAVALVLLDWAWARIAATPGAQAARWQAPRQAFTRHVLPEFDMRMRIIEARCAESRESAVA